MRFLQKSTNSFHMKSELSITFWEHDLYEHTDDMTLQAQKGHRVCIINHILY